MASTRPADGVRLAACAGVARSPEGSESGRRPAVASRKPALRYNPSDMRTKPKTVLVVDDDAATRARTVALLQRHYRVLAAASR